MVERYFEKQLQAFRRAFFRLGQNPRQTSDQKQQAVIAKVILFLYVLYTLCKVV